jgi:cobalt-factor III methyltransferase
MKHNGKLLIVGFGPGSAAHLTERAREAIRESQVIIGYNTYVDLIKDQLTDQEIVQTGMTEEVSRAQEAVRQAEQGRIVAVISSGDAGVYGMAGLVYEVLVEKGWSPRDGVEVEVIPGISAIQSCASLLGAPVMHDACTISLSDHLTPWATIAKRVEAAAEADFVIALYNPRSGRRTRQIVETQQILLKHRSPETPVGLVKAAYRDSQDVVFTSLGDMLNHDIGMLTTVIVGNSTTFYYDGLIITPRGYQRKYTLDSEQQSLRPHERLRTENEPWSLRATAEVGDREQVEKENTNLSVRQLSSLELAEEALEAVTGRKSTGNVGDHASRSGGVTSILEIGVAPGVAQKKFSPGQLTVIAEAAGETGEIEYTTQHQLLLRIPTDRPAEVTGGLRDAGLLVFPAGDFVQIKACDFCNLEKDEAIPAAEKLNRLVGGLKAPKELKIGFNGCGMACYGAVFDDIGIVYRRGAYDLFLGGKSIGRNAHAAQLAEEGISEERLMQRIETIVEEYRNSGYPNERFHKFFKRVKQVGGYEHREQAAVPVVAELACGE